jgi:ribosomal protein S25
LAERFQVSKVEMKHAGDDESRVPCSTLEFGQQRLKCSLALRSLQTLESRGVVQTINHRNSKGSYLGRA